MFMIRGNDPNSPSLSTSASHPGPDPAKRPILIQVHQVVALQQHAGSGASILQPSKQQQTSNALKGGMRLRHCRPVPDAEAN
jgi:hypothetical protein